MKIIGKNAVAELIKTDKTVDKILVLNGLRDDGSRALVKEAKNFASTITLEANGKSAAAKGLMGVMGMAVKQGNEVTVTVEGEDEEAAVAAMKDFFEKNLQKKGNNSREARELL